jgi:hypothetical protein
MRSTMVVMARESAGSSIRNRADLAPANGRARLLRGRQAVNCESLIDERFAVGHIQMHWPHRVPSLEHGLIEVCEQGM